MNTSKRLEIVESKIKQLSTELHNIEYSNLDTSIKTKLQLELQLLKQELKHIELLSMYVGYRDAKCIDTLKAIPAGGSYIIKAEVTLSDLVAVLPDFKEIDWDTMTVAGYGNLTRNFELNDKVKVLQNSVARVITDDYNENSYKNVQIRLTNLLNDRNTKPNNKRKLLTETITEYFVVHEGSIVYKEL